MNAAEVAILVKAKDEASKVLENIDKKAGGLSKTLSGALKIGAFGAAAGIGALAFGLKGCVEEALEAEEIMAQTNAVLKSTKGIAGVTAKEVTNLAEALAKETKFSDEAIQSAENVLLTFTKVGKEIFPEATEAILNVSTALGTDLQSATTMVGKALNDPIAGITAMTRAGIQFTDEQKDMIKSLVDAGDQMGAQKIILAELETQFGDSARAAGDTFGGKMVILKNQIDEVKEKIGLALIPILSDAAGAFSDFLTDNEDEIAAFTDWLAVKIPEAIDAIVKKFKDAQPTIQEIGDTLAKGFDVFKPALQWVLDNEEAVIVAAGAIATAVIVAFTPVTVPMLAVVGALLLIIYTAGIAKTEIDKLRQENEDLDAILNELETSGIPLLSKAIDYLVKVSWAQWNLIIYAGNEFMTDTWEKMVLVRFQLGLLTGTFDLARDSAIFLWDALEPIRDVLTKIADAAGDAADAIGRIPTLPGGVPNPLSLLKKARDILPFASGGVVPSGGGLQLVGERGPEIVSLPGGSRVFSNADSQAMGGNNINIDIVVAGDANDSTVDRIKRAVREEVDAALRTSMFRGSYVTSGAFTPS